jgi:hypothetical protein
LRHDSFPVTLLPFLVGNNEGDESSYETDYESEDGKYYSLSQCAICLPTSIFLDAHVSASKCALSPLKRILAYLVGTCRHVLDIVLYNE